MVVAGFRGCNPAREVLLTVIPCCESCFLCFSIYRRPTVVTCNALISAFAEGSQWPMALQASQLLPKATSVLRTCTQVLRSLPERSLTPTVGSLREPKTEDIALEALL